MKVLRTVLHLLESICSNNQMPQQQQNREWGGGIFAAPFCSRATAIISIWQIGPR